jgi:PKHD-type hydroxylase
MLSVREAFFNQDFIDLVEAESKEVESIEALVGGFARDDIPQNSSARRSTVKIFESPMVSHTLYEVVNEINATEYGFDIYGFAQLQYTVYDESNQGHYDWHKDDNIIGKGIMRRKLSVSVQLSDDDEYEGGNFEMQGMDFPDNIRKKGSILVFPSYELHRVTPVTKGTRKSLVAWFVGPLWR